MLVALFAAAANHDSNGLSSTKCHHISVLVNCCNSFSSHSFLFLDAWANSDFGARVFALMGDFSQSSDFFNADFSCLADGSLAQPVAVPFVIFLVSKVGFVAAMR